MSEAAASPSGQLPPTGSIAVLGAGSWGTALAIQLARADNRTTLWGRDSTALAGMAASRSNQRYLPDAMFPAELSIDPDLERVVRGHRDLLVCVPSQAFRGIIESIAPHLGAGNRISWASKGFEQSTGKLPHEVAAEVLGETVPLAVLSGPTFAREVAAGLPTALTVAATSTDFSHELAQRISSRHFRAYTSTDMVGVEVGGAVKNVIAIGAGISDGLDFGANARMALINRGLAEMTRLGVALGARKETFMGLSGMGDLVLTCTDNQSRNRRFGLLIASGLDTEAAVREIGFVCEGVFAARAIHEVAGRLGVDMPICRQIYRILYEGVAPGDAVSALMSRALGPE